MKVVKYMFYEKQSKEQQDNYKSMLNIIGSLSNVFSESEKPYLYYRCHENIFCKYFEAKNLSREDCSADADSCLSLHTAGQVPPATARSVRTRNWSACDNAQTT